MARTLGLVLLFAFLVGQVVAQEVFIARDARPVAPKAEPVVAPKPSPDLHVEKAIAVRTEKVAPAPNPPAEGPTVTVAKAAPVIETPTAPKLPPAIPFPATPDNRVVRKDTPFMTRASDSRLMAVGAKPIAAATPKREIVSVPRATPNPLPAAAIPLKAVEVAPVAKATPNPAPATISAPKKVEIASIPHPAAKAPPAKPKKIETVAIASAKIQSRDEQSGPRISEAAAPQPVSFSGDTAFIKLADGFDFPIGKPDAQGYYKARGFRSHGHLGEDWDGVGGGDTDLGDPIYCIGDGVVVFARDCHMGWGNVLIVRHSYRDGGVVKNIDSLYGHLQTILVRRGQSVTRGQKVATMGNAHGLYDAHLHLEIRKNLEIGMSRAAFARDFSNYYDPTTFIASHRHLQTGGGTYRVALNTFTHDARINWSKARNYSHAQTGGGSSESAAALKKAVAASKH